MLLIGFSRPTKTMASIIGSVRHTCKKSLNKGVFRIYNQEILGSQPMSTHVPQSMKAWEIKKYGGIEELCLNSAATVPVLKRPDDVLIKIHAASVNPIDLRQIAGYGKTLLNQMRKSQGWLKNGSEFPLVLGKDFSGTVVKTGMNRKSSGFGVGVEVWGAMTTAGSGCFAEYAILPASSISKKPLGLSHTEAASMPYVTITAWGALCTKSGLNRKNTRGKRVLVLGGSGGVGTFAIQLMKAWGAEVITTCSGDAVELLSNLGADIILDYKASDPYSELERAKGKGFDVILDCTTDKPDKYMPLLKRNANASYVTLLAPVLGHTDKYGMPIGLAMSALTMGPQFLQRKLAGQNYHWALTQPSVSALKTVSDLVDKNMVSPVVQQVFPFNELPAALQRLSKGPNRGKIVVAY